MEERETETLGRRQFMGWVTTRGVAVGLATAAVPTAIAVLASRRSTTVTSGVGQRPQAGGGEALVSDVKDFALTSEDWTGDFGFVTFELHRGAFDGQDVFFIRTDASDESFASDEGLVHVPKLEALIEADLIGRAYIIDGGVDGQPVVLSSEPGRDDYTPAWRLYRASWDGEAVKLSSVEDVERAEDSGDLEIETTDIVVNYPVVKWSGGEMSVDDERTGYLGPGQLLAPVNTEDMEVTFKLHECYPNARYIVTDVGGAPMAENMNIVFSPNLAGSAEAKATGRVNVVMGGYEGPGPMGGQPSVFDTEAGDAVWSPYWEHFTYAWKEGEEPRVFRTEAQVHEARDDGIVEEHPGTPATEGNTFVVNCPVPVKAANTWEPPQPTKLNETGDGSLGG